MTARLSPTIAYGLVALLYFTRFFFMVSAIADNCSSLYITLPVTDLEIANDTYSRGIVLSFGTPQQELALAPQWPTNNTWLYNSKLCGDSTSDAACLTSRGGYYYDNQSSTFKAFDDVAAAGGAPTDSVIGSDKQGFTGTGGTDVFYIGNETFSGYPLGLPTQGIADSYHPENTLGLGPNSTFLTALLNAGKIGSRTWSLFWGLNGGNSAVKSDGVLVLGGYDQAKVTGNNHTEAISGFSVCPSGMIVTIKDIRLNFPNGTDPSLLSQNYLTACIRPDFPTVLTMPDTPYFQNFESITQTENIGRSGGVNFYNMLYSPDNVYEGDMTITFDSGVSVRVPNDQLVIPELKIRSDGTTWSDSTNLTLMIMSNREGNLDDMPILGRQFLTSAYVMGNHDTNSFTLWAADTSATDSQLVPVLNEAHAAECDVSAQPTLVASRTGTSYADATGEASTSNGSSTGSTLSPGAIAGIAIGSVAVAALLALAIFLWLRRARQRRAAPASPAQLLQHGGAGGPPPQYSQEMLNEYALGEVPGSMVPELNGSGGFLHEMWAGNGATKTPRLGVDRRPVERARNTVYELDG